MWRMFAGALAISTGESFIGASPEYSIRGCQSASAAGSLKPRWNWASYLRPRGSHFEVRHAQTDTVSNCIWPVGRRRRRWSAAAGRQSRSGRAPVPRRSSAQDGLARVRRAAGHRLRQAVGRRARRATGRRRVSDLGGVQIPGAGTAGRTRPRTRYPARLLPDPRAHLEPLHQPVRPGAVPDTGRRRRGHRALGSRLPPPGVGWTRPAGSSRSYAKRSSSRWRSGSGSRRPNARPANWSLIFESSTRIRACAAGRSAAAAT